jgi:hypothetical protein
MRLISKTLFAAGLAAVPLFFTGCDVPVDFWQEQSVKVLYENPDLLGISHEEDVDIGQNSAVAGKASLIKNVQIPEVWINVDKIYGEGDEGPANKTTKVNGTMTITDLSEGTTFAPLTLTYKDVPVAAGGRVELTPEQADIDRLQNLIQTKGKFHVKYSGSIDQVPAHFDLTGKIRIIAAVGS